MPRLPPLEQADLPGHEGLFASIESHLGVLPNSTLNDGAPAADHDGLRQPQRRGDGSGTVDAQPKQLVALMVSSAATCRYCRAHTAHVAHDRGVTNARIEALFEHQTSDLFDGAERAALTVAEGAGHGGGAGRKARWRRPGWPRRPSCAATGGPRRRRPGVVPGWGGCGPAGRPRAGPGRRPAGAPTPRPRRASRR